MFSNLLDLIPPLFRAPLMRGLVNAFVNQFNDLGNASEGTIQGWIVANAQGVQLDAIGAGVDIERGMWDDNEYRRIIQAAFKANTSEETKEDIIEVISTVLNTDDVQVFQQFPAGIRIQAQGILTEERRLRVLVRLLKRTIGSGIDLGGIWFQDSEYFAWDGDTNPNAGNWDSPWMRYISLGSVE